MFSLMVRRGALIVALSGRVDDVVGDVRQLIGRLTGPMKVVVDLADKTGIGSPALGALVSLVRNVKSAGGCVAVRTADPVVLRQLRNTGIDQLVTVLPRIDDCLLAVGAVATVMPLHTVKEPVGPG